MTDLPFDLTADELALLPLVWALVQALKRWAGLPERYATPATIGLFALAFGGVALVNAFPAARPVAEAFFRVVTLALLVGGGRELLLKPRDPDVTARSFAPGVAPSLLGSLAQSRKFWLTLLGGYVPAALLAWVGWQTGDLLVVAAGGGLLVVGTGFLVVAIALEDAARARAEPPLAALSVPRPTSQDVGSALYQRLYPDRPVETP